eukprot:TRINITY_DN15619_c0_g1_i1.p1 TRINITY_DN15619_c0_g1~~TRINITY_DN15619_c0_g1_i1.p1  ORF type:complete len:235 (-),score=65.55 TRINITY_DN15619_c0_g1_i1:11-676(-)
MTPSSPDSHSTGGRRTRLKLGLTPLPTATPEPISKDGVGGRRAVSCRSIRSSIDHTHMRDFEISHDAEVAEYRLIRPSEMHLTGEGKHGIAGDDAEIGSPLSPDGTVMVCDDVEDVDADFHGTCDVEEDAHHSAKKKRPMIKKRRVHSASVKRRSQTQLHGIDVMGKIREWRPVITEPQFRIILPEQFVRDHQNFSISGSSLSSRDRPDRRPRPGYMSSRG